VKDWKQNYTKLSILNQMKNLHVIERFCHFVHPTLQDSGSCTRSLWLKNVSRQDPHTELAR